MEYSRQDIHLQLVLSRIPIMSGFAKYGQPRRNWEQGRWSLQEMPTVNSGTIKVTAPEDGTRTVSSLHIGENNVTTLQTGRANDSAMDDEDNTLLNRQVLTVNVTTSFLSPLMCTHCKCHKCTLPGTLRCCNFDRGVQPGRQTYWGRLSSRIWDTQSWLQLLYN
jgi:hypothetical protein